LRGFINGDPSAGLFALYDIRARLLSVYRIGPEKITPDATPISSVVLSADIDSMASSFDGIFHGPYLAVPSSNLNTVQLINVLAVPNPNSLYGTFMMQ
jgi:hypothetical protein